MTESLILTLGRQDRKFLILLIFALVIESSFLDVFLNFILSFLLNALQTSMTEVATPLPRLKVSTILLDLILFKNFNIT